MKVQVAAEFLFNKGLHPHIGIILGTGLSKLVDFIETEIIIPYAEIPGFPISTVESHPGRIIYGSLAGKKVMVLQGRFHFYEGYTFSQVVFPVRVMKHLGVEYILISNAAGAVNLKFKKGSMMIIDDHINLLPGNPLIGPNDDAIGTRFPDMSSPYDKNLNILLKEIATDNNITIYKGVYAAVTGPMLETRAEYRYLKKIGADAVGMSTVPEVIAAAHMKLKCCAVSVLTDECDPDNLQPVSISEIIEVAGKADSQLAVLFKELVSRT